MRRVFLVLAAGLAVGAWGRACDHLSAPAWHWLSALGAPWLVAAFAVGAASGRQRRAGAVCGALSLALGVLAYYALFRFVEHRTSLLYAGAMGVAWSAAALPIGALFGWAGAAWRDRRGPVASGLLAGALLGEALLLRTAWDQPAALRVLQLEAAAGIAVALLLSRSRLRAGGMSAASAVAVVVAEEAVRHTLRMAGWAGA